MEIHAVLVNLRDSFQRVLHTMLGIPWLQLSALRRMHHFVLDCWTAPCMSGRFYTELQEQRLFVWKEVTGIRENRANRV